MEFRALANYGGWGAAARAALERPDSPLAVGTASVRIESLDASRQYSLAAYVLGLQELLAGDSRAARLISWQHLVAHAGSPKVALAETVVEDTAHPLGRVSDDPPFMAETMNAVALAVGAADDGDYELRLMVVPVIYVQAIWLANASDPQGDKFIIITAAGLADPGTLLDASSWFSLLQAEARRAFG